MLLTRMAGYSYPTIAIYPFRRYEMDYWIMKALKLLPSGELKWMPHYIDAGGGMAKGDGYHSFEDAHANAANFNQSIRARTSTLALSDELKLSVALQAEKQVTAEERLTREEQLMLVESIKCTASHPRPAPESLVLPKDGGKYLDDLLACLSETPEVKWVHLMNHRKVLRRKEDRLDWSKVYILDAKSAKYCFRERIASGFGLSGIEHWGKTKAKIRELLLPRANRLLQLASVKMMLDQALARGQRVVVVDSFVFWYEQGKEVGWTVKAVGGDASGASGKAIWKEGKIVSKNHGRIVVLPYIKDNGEYVQGYTKNSSSDGKALPRHPDHFVELPFEVLKGDHMIGLFGELPYE